MRSASGRRLGSERKKLEQAGTEVVLIQPTAEDLEIMGGNLMSSKRRHDVIELATRTVRAAASPRASRACRARRPCRRATRTASAGRRGPAVGVAAAHVGGDAPRARVA